MIILQDHGRRLPSVLLSAIGQDFYVKPGRMDATVLTRFLHREHQGAFQPGASNDPTANHDERCTLASHAITVARGCTRNRNRHRYRLPRRPPAPTRRMALATQARRRYVSDAFRGARIRKDLGRPRHRGGTATRPRPVHRRKAQTSHRPLCLGGTPCRASHSTSLRRPPRRSRAPGHPA